MPEPNTREEQFYDAIATGDASGLPDPVTRKEKYLAAIAAGETSGLPTPITREEQYLDYIAEHGGGGGGGGDITVEPLSVTENNTYTAPAGKAYSPVTVAVPNSYAAADEGKVVSNGALVAQTSDTVTDNDTYDTTLINSLTVNVSGGGDTLNSHFLVIKKETITVGENSVTDGLNCVSYLMGMLSDPGDYFVFMSLHEKESYVRKEWAMCLSPKGIGGSGYRFENGGVTTTMSWGEAYDVLLVPGSVIDVYTYSNLNL